MMETRGNKIEEAGVMKESKDIANHVGIAPQVDDSRRFKSK